MVDSFGLGSASSLSDKAKIGHRSWPLTIHHLTLQRNGPQEIHTGLMIIIIQILELWQVHRFFSSRGMKGTTSVVLTGMSLNHITPLDSVF